MPAFGLASINDPWVRAESSAFCYNYECSPGPTSAFDTNSTVLDVFSKFFTDEVWDLLVTETNHYADDTRIVSPSYRAWQPISIEEMKALLG